MEDHNLHPGTTIVPEALRTCQVVSEKLNSNELVIDGTTITGITQDADNEDPTKIPSSLVLNQLKNSLEKRIEDLKTYLQTTTFNPVLSNPVVDEYFYGSFWEKSDDIILDNSRAYYTNRQEPKPNQAQLRIPEEALVKVGKYFFSISVEQLPSGDITIANEKLETIMVINDPGDYEFEAEVTNPSTAFFTATINYMMELDTCIISRFSVTYVRSDFEKYMDFKVKEYAFGPMAEAVESLREEVRTAITAMQEYVRQSVENTQGILNLHKNNKNNPHNVTYAQIMGT